MAIRAPDGANKHFLVDYSKGRAQLGLLETGHGHEGG